MMNSKFEHDDLVSAFNKEKELKKWYKMFKVYEFKMGDGKTYYSIKFTRFRFLGILSSQWVLEPDYWSDHYDRPKRYTCLEHVKRHIGIMVEEKTKHLKLSTKKINLY